MSGMIAAGTVACAPRPTGGFCVEVLPGPGQCCPTYQCDDSGGGTGGDSDTTGQPRAYCGEGDSTMSFRRVYSFYCAGAPELKKKTFSNPHVEGE